MTQIVFYTPTILPKACLFTMGVSAKETEHPIGFFGTGLKYAIAVCMRLGAEIVVRINKGETDYILWTFEKFAEDVRNKEFTMLKCHEMIRNGDMTSIDPQPQRMPMTLDYGKTWEPWMALRELYSNTVDEKGEMFSFESNAELPHHLRAQAGTYITVTAPHDHDLITAWDTRYDTWLLDPNRTPVWENKNLQVYMRPSSALYYKGIRVSQSGFESSLTYNLLRYHVLTEDRTINEWDYCFDYQYDIMQINKRDIVKRLLEASGNTKMAEAKFYLNRITSDASEQFKEEAISLYKRDPNLISTTAREAVQHYMRKHSFSDLYTVASITQEEQDRYDKCLRILYDAGFLLHKYKIRICEMDDSNVLGTADKATSTIVISDKLLRMEDWKHETCTTLMEEYIHLEFDVRDCSRQFQDITLSLIYDALTKGVVRSNNSMLAGLEAIAKKS